MKKKSFAFRLQAWFNNLPIQDPMERRMASLLQIILIGLIAIILVATLVLMVNPSLNTKEKFDALRGNFLGFLVVALPLSLLRRGYFRSSALLIITVLFITPALAITVVFDLPNSAGILIQFTLAIILSGLLVSRRALAIVFGLSTALVAFSAFQAQSAEPRLARISIETAINFILFNGLIALFLDYFGITLRTALTDALAREVALQSEITDRRQAEMALSLSEQRSNALIENSWDAIALFGADGTILYGSPSTTQILGYSLDEFVGRSAFELIHPEDRAIITERLTLSLQQPGVHIPVYARVRHKNGEWRWLEGVFTNLLDEPGVRAIVNNYHDFTERKQAEEALRESEDKFKYIFDHSIIGKTITLPDGGITVNQAFCEMLGYREEELVHKKWQEITHPDDIELSSRATQLLLSGEDDSARFTKRYIHKNGSVIWVDMSTSLRRDEQGQPLYFMTALLDITERKEAEETLRESEAKFSAAFQSTPLALVITTLDGKFIETNRAFCELVGVSNEELIGKTEIDIELFNAESRENLMAVLKDTGGAIRNYEIQFQVRDGSRRDILYSVETVAFHGVLHRLSTGLDITDRKRAEEKIHKQNERLKVLREIDTAILAADSVENIIRVALNHIRELIDCRHVKVTLIDWETNECLIFDESTVNETSIPKGTRFPLGLYQDLIQTLSQEPQLLMNDLRELSDPSPEIHGLLKDGVQSLCSLSLSSQGNLIGMLSMYSEFPDYFDDEKISLGNEIASQVTIAITQSSLLRELRTLNEELEQRVGERTVALSQANALLQTLLDNMPDQIYFKDSHSRFIRNSKSQAKALGLSDPAEAVGKSDFDFFPHAQMSFEKEQEIIRTGKPVVDEEERVVWPDGQETWVSTTKVPLPDQSGQIVGTFGISRDITERKQSEVALQKAKLELEAANKELEAFSYSVSHDLRSPLRTIDGFSLALLEDFGDLIPADGRNYLERIRSSAQRMAALIDDLLNLARVTRAQINVVPVDLAKLAENILIELQRTEPQRNVRYRVAPNLHALGDPQLLQIVLENLINNAWKYSSKQMQAEIEFGSKNENDEIIFFVRDNGAGFDMAYANKMFGAFQRLHTATEFPGTGIGLATVQRIIHRHGGHIWAEGAVDQGATFFFTLPPLEHVHAKTR